MNYEISTAEFLTCRLIRLAKDRPPV